MADGFYITPDWTQQLSEYVRRVDLAARLAVGAAAYEHMLNVMDVAKDRCPYKSGALANSGTVDRVRVTAQDITVSMHFGVNPPLSYALRQHEDLTLHHPGGKRAKFLESAIIDWINEGGPEEVVRDAESIL